MSVFLCHASEDKARVRQLAAWLRCAGFLPWLDEERLLPGQDWELEVGRAVRAAAAVVVCLSQAAVSKAGFVQKEVRSALDAADHQPEGAIYIIPCKLDDVAVPERLRRWQWVDLREPNGYERLKAALTRRYQEADPQETGAARRSVSPQLLDRLRSVTLDAKMFEDAVVVLRHPSFPRIMSLSGEIVLNPIWTAAPQDVEQRLGSRFRPDGPTPPRVMSLDIFLIKAGDSLSRPHLLTYFSGKPKSGWQAFLFPFRQRDALEAEPARASLNAKDLASFLGVTRDSVSVTGLARKYAVSVKPDPGYGELVAYLFTFCSVELISPPEWLAQRDAEYSLESTTRRFHWFHPEELERDEVAMRVNADLIRAIHYLFATTIPAVPSSVAPGFLKD